MSGRRSSSACRCRCRPGSFAGVIGPSGAGKTTLLKAILGLAARFSGEVRVQGEAIRPGEHPARVGYVPQVETVDWSFPATVNDVVLMGLSVKPGRLPWTSRALALRVADAIGGAAHLHDVAGRIHYDLAAAIDRLGRKDIADEGLVPLVPAVTVQVPAGRAARAWHTTSGMLLHAAQWSSTGSATARLRISNASPAERPPEPLASQRQSLQGTTPMAARSAMRASVAVMLALPIVSPQVV